MWHADVHEHDVRAVLPHSSFTLTGTASGRTLVQRSETFSGAFIPFSGTTLGRTRAGFDEMNQALAHEALKTPLHEPPG